MAHPPPWLSSPLLLCPSQLLPTPPEPTSLCHDELYHLPSGTIFPHQGHHLSQHLWRLNCLPTAPLCLHQYSLLLTPFISTSPSHPKLTPISQSPPPPESSPSNHHLNTALVVTPAPASYPHPPPNHRGISLLTVSLLSSPHACYHCPHHLHHQ